MTSGLIDVYTINDSGTPRRQKEVKVELDLGEWQDLKRENREDNITGR